MHIHLNLVKKYLYEMCVFHPSINIHDTINSGQIFLWENYENTWFVIDGNYVISIKQEKSKNYSLTKEAKKFFRDDDDINKIIKNNFAIVSSYGVKIRWIQVDKIIFCC